MFPPQPRKPRRSSSQAPPADENGGDHTNVPAQPSGTAPSTPSKRSPGTVKREDFMLQKEARESMIRNIFAEEFTKIRRRGTARGSVSE